MNKYEMIRFLKSRINSWEELGDMDGDPLISTRARLRYIIIDKGWSIAYIKAPLRKSVGCLEKEGCSPIYKEDFLAELHGDKDQALLRETIDLAHRAGGVQGKPYIEMVDLLALMPNIVFDGMLSTEERESVVAMNERFRYILGEE